MSYSVEASQKKALALTTEESPKISKSPEDQKTASVASNFFSKTSQFFRTLVGVPLAITFTAVAVPTTALMLLPQLLFKKVNASRATFFAFNIIAIPLQIILGLNRNLCDTIHEKNGNKLVLGMIPTNLNKHAFKEKVGLNQKDHQNSPPAIIDLTQEDERVTSIMGTPIKKSDWGADVNYINYQSPDGLPVSYDVLKKGSESIHSNLQNGNVIVHCKSGVGRSASIIIAYLIEHENQTFDHAFSFVNSKRQIRLSEDQKESLKNFESHIVNKKILTCSLNDLEIEDLQKIKLKLSGIDDKRISNYFIEGKLRSDLSERELAEANKANNPSDPVSQKQLGKTKESIFGKRIDGIDSMNRYEAYQVIINILSKKYKESNNDL